MRSSRNVLAALASCAVACSAFTDLRGFSEGGGLEAVAEDGGVVDGGSAATDGGVVADAPRSSRSFILVAGGAPGAQPYHTSVFVAEVSADGSLGAWRPGPELPEARARGGAAVVGDTVVLTGGDSLSGLAKTSIVGTLSEGGVAGWVIGGSLPYSTGLFRHTSIAHAGRVLLLGGNVVLSEHLADVHTAPLVGSGVGAWQTTLSLPTGRSSAATMVSGDHVYLVGGNDAAEGGESTASGIVGDLASDGTVSNWRSLPPLPYRTASNAGAATATHLYTVGGYASGPYDRTMRAKILADGTTDPWIDASKLQVGRAGHQMVAVRGYLYAIGGADQDNTRLASVEVAEIGADGVLSAWRFTTPLPNPASYAFVTTFESP